MICNDCGLPFDESDLSKVFEHEHKGIKIMETIKSKKVISHARDIYPNCTIGFAMGVHNYLSGDYDESRMYQESTDFKQGYYQAQQEPKWVDRNQAKEIAIKIREHLNSVGYKLSEDAESLIAQCIIIDGERIVNPTTSEIPNGSQK